MNIIIPMAGLGSRVKDEGFELPKPLIEVNNKTLIEHSVDTLGIKGQYIFITRDFENPQHNELINEAQGLGPDVAKIAKMYKVNPPQVVQPAAPATPASNSAPVPGDSMPTRTN